MVALGRKYDTGIFLSPTNETCFLCLYTCYLDEDYVPRYARNCVLYERVFHRAKGYKLFRLLFFKIFVSEYVILGKIAVSDAHIDYG